MLVQLDLPSEAAITAEKVSGKWLHRQWSLSDTTKPIKI